MHSYAQALESYMIPAEESNSIYVQDGNTIRTIYHRFNTIMKDNNIKSGDKTYRSFYNLNPSEDNPGYLYIKYPYFDDNYSGSGSDYDNGLSKSNKNEKFNNLLPSIIREFKNKYHNIKINTDGYRGHGYLEIVVNPSKYSRFDVAEDIERIIYSKKSTAGETSKKNVISKEDRKNSAEVKREQTALLKQILSECGKMLKSNGIQKRSSPMDHDNCDEKYSTYIGNGKDGVFASILYSQYSTERLELIKSYGMDAHNGKIVNIMPKIIDQLKAKYSNVNFKRIRREDADETMYIITVK